MLTPGAKLATRADVAMGRHRGRLILGASDQAAALRDFWLVLVRTSRFANAITSSSA